MKTKRTSMALFATLLLAAASAYGGEGTITGGGGHGIVIDGEVRLADPFLVRTAENQGNFDCRGGELVTMSPELRLALRHATRMMVRYGAEASYAARAYSDFKEESEFYEIQIKHARFCLVDSLPDRDETDEYNNPAGSSIHSVGHTEGHFTWLVRDIFERMNLLEQVKTIVHERLHAAAAGVPHGPIVDITNGLDVVLRAHSRQMRGDRSDLLNEDLEKIRLMNRSIARLRLGRGMIYELLPTGGMVAQNSQRPNQISPDAFIGVGSEVASGVILGAGAVVLNSSLCMVGASFTSARWGDGMHPDWRFEISEGVSILNSAIHSCGPLTLIGPDARLENARIALPRQRFVGFNRLDLRRHVHLKDVTLQGLGILEMQEFSSIENAFIHVSEMDLRRNDPYAANLRVILEPGARIYNVHRSEASSSQGKPHIFAGYDMPSLTFARNRVFHFHNFSLCGGEWIDRTGFSGQPTRVYRSGGTLWVSGIQRVNTRRELRSLCQDW